ncbi:MAG: alpha/beta fold hydrolase [Anaerolineae bacterium]|jgi:carboxylesterase|nr:alpha/beta fold hydrolase [Anaerolineae bacterium]
MLPITAFNGAEHQEFLLAGGDPAAVLVHGFPGTPLEMRPIGESLHRLGWTTHGVLLPGFGAEINTLNERRQNEWIDAILRALEGLRSTHRPVILIGHSMGGALAIEVATRFPVDRLILLAPFYKLEHVLWMMLPMLKWVIPQFKPFRLMKPDFRDPNFRNGVLNMMPELDLDDPTTQSAIQDFAIPVKMIEQIRIAGQNAYRHAPLVKAPTLIIQGERDELVRPAVTNALRGRFTVPTTSITVNAEHDLVRADRPAWPAIERAILAFVREFQP